MAFDETPRFPTKISARSSFGPSIEASAIAVDSGASERVKLHTGAIRIYDVGYALRKVADLTEVYDFYLGRDGIVNGFRFKDLLDFTTAANHRDAPSDDYQIGTGDGTETVFQLSKQYTSGAQVRSRTIEKPVASTTVVRVAGVLQTEGVNYTVDNTSGRITFTVAPTAGQSVTAGCEFDVPTQFDTPLSEGLLFQLEQGIIAGSVTERILLREMVGNVSQPFAFPYGNSDFIEVAGADFQITAGHGRTIHIHNTGGGTANGFLPQNKDDFELGGPYWYISVENAGSGINLRDGANTLRALSTGDTAQVWLTLTGATQRDWKVFS